MPNEVINVLGIGCVLLVTSLLLWGPAMVFSPASLQYHAGFFGVAGALLLAMQIDGVWGFAAFLVSNLGWLIFSAARRHYGLFAQQVAFLATSLIGLWNFWLGPLLG